MKIFKSFSLALLTVLTTATFTSCSDDDDNGPGSKKDLVGRWESVHEKGWYKENGKITEEWDEPDNSLRWDFYSDGTCVTFEKSTGSTTWMYPESGTYSYKGGNLVIRYDEDYTDGGKITKLTATELEVESFDSEREEDGTKCEEWVRITFRKTASLDD